MLGKEDQQKVSVIMTDGTSMGPTRAYALRDKPIRFDDYFELNRGRFFDAARESIKRAIRCDHCMGRIARNSDQAFIIPSKNKFMDSLFFCSKSCLDKGEEEKKVKAVIGQMVQYQTRNKEDNSTEIYPAIITKVLEGKYCRLFVIGERETFFREAPYSHEFKPWHWSYCPLKYS